MQGDQAKTENLDISERLRFLMSQHKLTVAELASRAGVSKSAMEKYLAGPSSPRATTVVTICKQFGVTSDWLLFPGMVQEYAAFRDEVSGVIIDLI